MTHQSKIKAAVLGVAALEFTPILATLTPFIASVTCVVLAACMCMGMAGFIGLAKENLGE